MIDAIKTWIKHWLSRIGFAFYLVGNLVISFIRNTWTGRIISMIVVPAIIVAFCWVAFVSPPEGNDDETYNIHIPRGATLRQVADSLLRYNLIRSKGFVTLWGRVSGKARQIKAGVLELPGGLDAISIVDSLGNAKTETVRVTLPEGTRAYEMARILHQTLQIDSVKFLALVKDSAFARRLTNANSLEGYLLPETYQLEKNLTAEQVIKFLCRNTLKIFETDSVRLMLDSLGYSIHEIITLASIVEGEALLDRERRDIASLYHNRLNRGMRLQADPTIQFAVPGPPRRLLYKDLEIDSPYNTYRYSGLPPGPINNPGKRSILASLFPTTTPYIYMVATGDGGHKFTTNLRDHNYWHRKFNEVRRRVQRQSR